MISRQEVERIAKLKSEHGILSAYIRMDPRLRFLRRQPVTQFKGAFKHARRRAQNSKWLAALDREAEYVLSYLSNSEFKGRGLVIFSCRPSAIWEVIPLQVLVPNVVEIDNTTKTAVLAETLTESPRFLVAVVQRDKARIYTAQHGNAERQSQIVSDVPGQHDQGGRSQMRFERHIEFHVSKHLKKVVDELLRLAPTGPFRLALGGTEETVDELLTMMPEALRRAFIGRFSVSHKHDSERQTLDDAEAVWKNREHFEAGKLFDQIVEAAGAGGRGALGVEPTLKALAEEKVQSLVVANGLALAGSVCTRCEFLSAERFSSCPLCGGHGEQREIADRAVEKAILTGADAQVVFGESRNRLLAAGGLGALLRY